MEHEVQAFADVGRKRSRWAGAVANRWMNVEELPGGTSINVTHLFKTMDKHLNVEIISHMLAKISDCVCEWNI